MPTEIRTLYYSNTSTWTITILTRATVYIPASSTGYLYEMQEELYILNAPSMIIQLYKTSKNIFLVLSTTMFKDK